MSFGGAAATSWTPIRNESWGYIIKGLSLFRPRLAGRVAVAALVRDEDVVARRGERHEDEEVVREEPGRRHGEHDDACYVDPKLRQSPLGRDCLKVAEGVLTAKGVSQAMVESWKTEATQKVEEAFMQAQREPAPDPYKEDWSALASRHLSEGYDEVL